MRNSIFVFAICFLFVTKATAQTTNYQAYSVFVYGLSKYTSWPSTGKTEFVIAVIGKSKAYDEMVKGLTGKSVNGLPIKVIQVETVSAASTAQILYISDGKSSMIDEIKKETVGKPVLIIAEREGLHKKGAGMSFIAIESKLRIDINSHELQSRQIKTSSQLQTLTHEVI
jgi:YfiR/HmsC-like